MNSKRHSISELPPWERMLKRIAWKQIGDISGKTILDFGSGEGITADHFAESNNKVIAVEPSEDMLENRWMDNSYEQIHGDVSSLKKFHSEYFDIIICHNVLEYINEKEKAEVVHELGRLLKEGGFLSLIKHNRNGRVMQMAVLLDNFEEANNLLDGKNSISSRFGVIRYYEDDDIMRFEPGLYIDKVYGIRTFWDLQQNQENHSDEEWQQKMMRLELRVSEMEDFRSVSFFHHLILRKRQQNGKNFSG